MVSSGKQGKVLLLDADGARSAALSHRLRYLDYEPLTPAAPDCVDQMAADSGVAVLLGESTPGSGIQTVFRHLDENRPDLPVLLMGRPTDVAASLRSHPAWTLDTPVRRTQLARLLDRARRYAGVERRHRISGNAGCVRTVRRQIEQVADFDTSVMITGESGTGKELVARTIHDLSARSDRPFVPINCGAIPPELLESELFGHEKGAFTGAVSTRLGRFELADGGTLFLDEIGDMSLPMQVKLLRVVQERAFERIGSNETRRCDVRLIAATHRDLPEAIARGEFRQDLYYRLNVFPIEMPPLCKRRSDLPLLLDELLIQHRGDDAGKLRFDAEALAALANYPWPGNIRELSNLVERLAILYPTGTIGREQLPEKYLEHAGDTLDEELPADVAPTLCGATLKAHLQSVEKALICAALDRSDGVVAGAARLLQLRRTTLVEKIGKYRLQ